MTAPIADWLSKLHDVSIAPTPSSGLVAAAVGQTETIRLNSGDPDRIAAPNVFEATIAALRTGRTHYQLGPGLHELRVAIAAKHALENGFTVDPEREVSVTNGSYEALACIMRTILDPGDEVITTDPFYGGHVNAIRYAGGTPRFVRTTVDDGWQPDPSDIERVISSRTKALIFASPGNPTGAILTRETLSAICSLAERHGFLVIADELFERYAYDSEHVSAASLTEAGDRVITVHGMSKSYCMTGWRIGWVAASAGFMQHFHKVRYAASMCANTVSQIGAVEALSSRSTDYYREVKADYGSRRSVFFKAWADVGLPQRPGAGAFVTMVDVRPLGRSSLEIAKLLLERTGTLVWPGTQFGAEGEGYLRVGLVEPKERLEVFRTRLAVAFPQFNGTVDDR